MATLIPADGGEPRFIEPQHGTAFRLEELQAMVGGYIEALRTPLQLADDGTSLWLIINDDGKGLGLPRNPFATALMRKVLSPDDYVVGDAVLCTQAEAGGPTPDDPET